jgi:hypothetical protein
MQSKSTIPNQYISELPEDRREPMNQLRDVILKNLPGNFIEVMNYGMIGYVIPHSVYPAGYHCDPKLPLPFAGLASQKNFIAIYHMGIYADSELMDWFTKEYSERVKGKLDMGKSCIRFKKPESIPFDLIGELFSKMTSDQWIAKYESAYKPKK